MEGETDVKSKIKRKRNSPKEDELICWRDTKCIYTKKTTERGVQSYNLQLQEETERKVQMKALNYIQTTHIRYSTDKIGLRPLSDLNEVGNTAIRDF